MSRSRFIGLLSLFCFILLPFQLCADNNEKQIHVTSPGKTDYIAVDQDKMWKNVVETATLYRKYAPIPRVAFYDITYPADMAEYDQLGGYAVLLITAISQLKEELPIKQVYVVTEETTIKLEQIDSRKSFIPPEPELISKTVGKYREDSIYLFPMYLRAQNAGLTIDFSINRSDFVLCEFPFEEDEFPVKEPAKEGPSQEVLDTIIKREIPIFTAVKL